MDAQPSQFRTLIVDDSEQELALIKALVRPIHSIKLIGVVQDGNEAISYLRAVEQFRFCEMFPYPDLMFLDFNMPQCDGMGVLKFMQKQLYRPRVVLWSNTLDRVDASCALRLGADLVCAKPKTKKELLGIVQHIQAKAFKTAPVVPLVIR